MSSFDGFKEDDDDGASGENHFGLIFTNNSNLRDCCWLLFCLLERQKSRCLIQSLEFSIVYKAR